MNSTDFDIIKSEILTDPSGIGYSGKSVSTQLSLLTSPNITIQGPIPMTYVAIWAANVDVASKLVDHANTPSGALRSQSIAFLNCIQGGYPSLDVSNGAVDFMIRQFEANGDFTDAQRIALYQYGQTKIARWQQLGISEVPHQGDVVYALSR